MTKQNLPQAPIEVHARAPDELTAPGCDLDKLLAGLDFPEVSAPGEKEKKTAGQACGLGTVTPLTRSVSKRYFYDLSTSRKALAQIARLPEEEESAHYIMGGEFHGFDLVIAIQSLAGEAAESLTMSTLGFNRHNVSHLCAMIDAGQVEAVSVLCSEYFRDADKEAFAFAKHALEVRGARLGAIRNHSKIVCMRFPGRRDYVIESSANLRSCTSIEQFSLSRSTALHDFHCGWINRVFPTA